MDPYLEAELDSFEDTGTSTTNIPQPRVQPSNSNIKRAGPKTRNITPEEQIEKLTDEQLEKEFADLDARYAESAPVIDASKIESTSYWGELTRIPRGLVKGYKQLIGNLFYNLPADITEALGAKNSKRVSSQYTGDESFAEKASGVMVEIGAPATAGAITGAAIGGPFAPVTGAIGGIIGAAIGAYAQDPNEGNLSTIVANSKYKNLPVIGPIADMYAHKPGDTALEARYKNMLEGVFVDLGAAGAVGAGSSLIKTAAKNRWAARTAKPFEEVYNVTKDYIAIKRGKPLGPIKENPTYISDEELIAKETQYQNIGKENAAEVQKIVNEEVPASSMESAEQLDLFDDIVRFEDAQEAQMMMPNIEQYRAESAAADLSPRQKAKSDKYYQPALGDVGEQVAPPTKEQLSLFDIDDVDVAGVSFDPKQASFFNDEFGRALPMQLDYDEDDFIKVYKGQVKDAQFSSEKNGAEFVATPADDSVNEALPALIKAKNQYYADKRARGESVSLDEVLGEAAKLATDSKYVSGIVKKVNAGEAINTLETAVIQNLYVNYGAEYEKLVTKVASGTANDLEIVAFQTAQDNFFKVADIYLGAGSEQGSTLGIRGLTRNWARSGDPEAIAAVQAEGKIKMVRDFLRANGGRESAENSAMLMQRFMLEARKPKGSREAIGEFTKEQVESLADKIASTDFVVRNSGQIEARSKLAGAAHAVAGYMNDNRLLHWNTVLKGILGPVGDSALAVPSKYLEAVFTRFTEGQRAYLDKLAEARGYRQGLTENIAAAYLDAVETFKSGLPASDGTFQATRNIEIDIPENIANSAKSNLDLANDVVSSESQLVKRSIRELPKKELTAGQQAYGFSLGLGRRLLMSADSFWSYLGQNAETRAIASRRASALGLRGEAADEYIKNAKFTPEEWEQIELNGAKLAFRADLELDILKSIDKNFGDSLGVKIFLPFFKTYANSIERTLEYFPLLGNILPSARADRTKAYAKQVTGFGALAMTALALDSDGTDPLFRDFKKFFESDMSGSPAGRRPYTIGGVILPTGGIHEKMVRIAAYMRVAADNMSEEEYTSTAEALSIGLYQIATPDEQFRAVADIYEILKQFNAGGVRETALTSVVTPLAESIVPGFRVTKDLKTINDLYERDLTGSKSGDFLDYVISTTANKLAAVIPFYDAKFLPYYNILGEQVPRPKGAFGIPNLLASRNGEVSKEMRFLYNMAAFSRDRGDNSPYDALEIKALPKIIEEPAVGRVELTPSLYKKYNSYYEGYDPETGNEINTGSLRSNILQIMDKHKIKTEQFTNGNITVSDFNNLVADVKNSIAESRSRATQLLKQDEEYIDLVGSRVKILEEQDLENSSITPKLRNTLGF